MRLSGDQNGKAAPSVPASWRASTEDVDRTQSEDAPLGPVVTNAICCPSGERANDWLNEFFSGGGIANRIVRLCGSVRRKYRAPRTSVEIKNNPATAHAARLNQLGDVAAGASSLIDRAAVVIPLPDELVGDARASSANPRSCAE